MTQVAPTTNLLAVVPTEHTKSVLATDASARTKQFDTYEDVINHVNDTYEKDVVTVLAPMGGPGQSLINRFAFEGYSVYRIPWFTLEEVLSLVATLDTPAIDRSRYLLAAFRLKPESFYPMLEIDRNISLLRELARVRGTIQRFFRIRAQQIYQAAERDLVAMLPEQQEYVKLRRTFADLQMIAAAKTDEAELTKRIADILKNVPIYELLRTQDMLPSVVGFGPAIAGSIIGEIGDIRRFPDPGKLRAYARYDVRDGAMRRSASGQVANWNHYLAQSVWLWSTDQVVKQKGSWNALYYFYKADYLRKHPEAEVVLDPATGKQSRRYYLGHLDRMAKRKVGSLLLEYIWHAWTHLIERPGNLDWYILPRTVYIEDEGPRQFVSFAGLFDSAQTYSEANRAYCQAEAARRGSSEKKREDLPELDSGEAEEVFDTTDPGDDIL